MKRPPALRTLVLAVTVIASLVMTTTALAFSYTNNTPGEADNGAFNRTVNVSEAMTITDVNVEITWSKVAGTCAAPDNGVASHESGYFELTSPSGSTVTLISVETYGPGGTNTTATVMFDDSAGADVGGTVNPVSGTFRPRNPLDTFNGEPAAGVWNLVVGNDVGGASLCFQSFTLYINGGGGSGKGDIRDDRINWKHGDGYAVVYPRKDAQGNPVLHVYCVDQNGRGYLGDVITQAVFDKAPVKPSTNTKVGEITICLVPVKFYVLTTGEYQINIGPNAEGKVDVIVFTGLPPTKIHYHRLK